MRTTEGQVGFKQTWGSKTGNGGAHAQGGEKKEMGGVKDFAKQ